MNYRGQMYRRILSVDKGCRSIWVLLWTNSTFVLKRTSKNSALARLARV